MTPILPNLCIFAYILQSPTHTWCLISHTNMMCDLCWQSNFAQSSLSEVNQITLELPTNWPNLGPQMTIYVHSYPCYALALPLMTPLVSYLSVCVRARSLLLVSAYTWPPQGGWGRWVPPERKRCVAHPLTPDYIVTFPNAEH